MDAIHQHSYLASGEQHFSFRSRMGDDEISRAFTPGEDHEQIINLSSDDPFPLLDPGDFPSVCHRGRRTQKRKRRGSYRVCDGNKRVLVFNNNIIVGVDERIGSNQDIENLRHTFERKQFIVKVYEDLTKEDLEKVLEEHRTSQDLKKTSALIMIFMSHGDGKDAESFLSSDGKSINIKNDIRTRFNDRNCPALAGKPKVMIGVFCRNIEEGKDARTPPEHPAKPCISTQSDEKDFNDMMTIFSCARGKISNRDEMGTFFIQAFCKIINERGHKYDMYRIYTETQKEMREKSPPDNTSLEGFEPCMEPPLTFGTLYLA